MLKYEKFRQTVFQIIQQSGLDVGAVYFIFKDITRELEKTYFQQVQKDNLEEQKQNESEEKEDS